VLDAGDRGGVPPQAADALVGDFARIRAAGAADGLFLEVEGRSGGLGSGGERQQSDAGGEAGTRERLVTATFLGRKRPAERLLAIRGAPRLTHLLK
jgi:hypothetical protein